MFRARTLEWVSISSCGGSSQPRDGTLAEFPTVQADFLPLSLSLHFFSILPEVKGLDSASAFLFSQLYFNLNLNDTTKALVEE